MKIILLTFVSLAAVAACSTTTNARPTSEDRSLARFTADRLETFGSERAFTDYLRRVRSLAQGRGELWAGIGVQYASLDQPPATPCDPAKEKCADESKDPVIVTGSMIAAPPANAAMPVQTLSVEKRPTRQSLMCRRWASMKATSSNVSEVSRRAAGRQALRD